jgi:hypothetical protein
MLLICHPRALLMDEEFGGIYVNPICPAYIPGCDNG